MKAIVVAKLSVKEARDLTVQIREAVENTWSLLVLAKKGEAWSALGYASWTEYVRVEFQMSKQHSYRLLDYAQVREVLAESPLGDSLPSSERQVRPLAQLPAPQQREAWQAAVESAPNGKPTAKEVTAAVSNLDPSRIRPITPTPGTKEQQQQISEAEKDSETLWLLKSYWKKARKTERAEFRAWIETT